MSVDNWRIAQCGENTYMFGIFCEYGDIILPFTESSTQLSQ